MSNVNITASLNEKQWDELLPQNDPKRDFIMQGVRKGFKLSELDCKEASAPILMKNYYSAFKYRHPVQHQILEELENGRYLLVKDPPKIISAIGAIPKKNGKIRLIHDCSRPAGNAVNDFAIRDKFKYQNLQDAMNMISPGDFLAKVDLQSAYRSVRVSPDEHEKLGISWVFEGAVHPSFMVDCCLPFGHARSPFVFNELSQAVCRIMKVYGYEYVMAYLDDFLIASRSFQECRQALMFLISILRRLGFAISYPKVEGPVQRLTFLGFKLDTIELTVSLTRERVAELNQLLSDTLLHAKITKGKIQSIIGKLNYCTQVVYGGRFFLRRLINIVNTLKQPWHRTRVTKEMRADIQWWMSFGLIFCSKPLPMVQPRRGGNVALSMDASGLAAGSFFMGDCCYSQFGDRTKDLCINYKEILALLPAVEKWGHYFANKHLHVYSDNMCAVNTINKGSSKHPVVMSALRKVFWCSVYFNFRITCHYYPGVRNVLADAVSRLHEKSGVLRYNELLSKWYQTNAFNQYICFDEGCSCHGD